jgi:hypothetical protein
MKELLNKVIFVSDSYSDVTADLLDFCYNDRFKNLQNTDDIGDVKSGNIYKIYPKYGFK